jgi:hypothetical protein
MQAGWVVVIPLAEVPSAIHAQQSAGKTTTGVVVVFFS